MRFRNVSKIVLVIALSVSVSGCESYLNSLNDLKTERESWFTPAFIFTMLVMGGIVAVGATSASRTSRGSNFFVPPSPGGGGGAPPVTSDIRLKREVRHIATLESGMKLYTFKYLDSDTTYVGVMAQDLLVNPEWREAVVTSPSGYYSVKYDELGFRLVTSDEWRDGVSMTRLSVFESASERPLKLQPAL
jgi:hypothetical protein